MAQLSDFPIFWASGVVSQLRGQCQNSEPGTFNHECGKPATWVGTRSSKLTLDEVFHASFCDDCKQHGWEARGITSWTPLQAEAI